MKLKDLLEPGDEPLRPKKIDIKALIRDKAFKSKLKALSTMNNPKKDQAPEFAGDGGYDEPPTDDNTTASALI